MLPEHAFYCDAMPCNSIPFLDRLLEILKSVVIQIGIGRL